MKKAMISQPMAGKTEQEIKGTRDKAISALQEQGYEIVNTLFTDEWYSNEQMTSRGVVQIPLCFLAKSLENMANCHSAYFCKGWENTRGCKIEHDTAVAYGLEVIYEYQLKTTHTKRGNTVSIYDDKLQMPRELEQLMQSRLKELFGEPRNTGFVSGDVSMDTNYHTQSDMNIKICPSCSGLKQMQACAAVGGNGYSKDHYCSTCNGTGVLTIK